MAKKKETKLETHLPVKKVLAVFLSILAIVAVIAAIVGENQKIRISGRKLMDRVANRDFDEAYKLLGDNAKSRIKDDDFRVNLAALRNYLRVKYGPDYKEKYKYYFDAPFWIPWRGDDIRKVSFGVYRKKGTIKSEIIGFITKPEIEAPIIDNMLTVGREDGVWKIIELNFDPQKYPLNENGNTPAMPSIFSPTENGFVLKGIEYDRPTTSPEQRAWLLDALKQAVHELETDSGKKNQEEELNPLKIIP